jgi:chaperonin cofactor prefoldin
MPKTWDIFASYIKNELTKETNEKLDNLSKEVAMYKTQKHSLRNENQILKQIIMGGDQNMISSAREVIRNEKE